MLLRVSEGAEEREDLDLVEVPDAARDVDIVLELLNDLLLGRGDGDESAAVEVKGGRVGALGDAVEHSAAHLEDAGVGLGLGVSEMLPSSTKRTQLVIVACRKLKIK